MRKKSQSRLTSPKRWKPSRRLLLILLVLVIGASGFAWHRHNDKKINLTPATSGIRSNNSIDYSPAKPSDNAATNQNKGSSPPASTPPASSSAQSGPSITITGANKNTSVSYGIDVSALAQGVTSGTCTFNFSKADGGAIQKSYNETVQLSVNYYTCPKITVSMPSGGDWFVSVVLTSGSQTATSKWAANPVVL